MTIRAALLAVVVGALALPLPAQEKLSETIVVRVLNVDVVVRDRAGKPVTGLTKDDFELWDNGKQQVITNLFEVKGTPPQGAVTASTVTVTAPPESRDRKIVMFIDNYSLPALRRNQILKSLEKFIDEKMQPGDKAMIVTWQQAPKIALQFTSDRKKMHETIASLIGTANAGSTNAGDIEQIKRATNELIDSAKEGRITFNDAYRSATLNVNSYAEQVTFTASRLLKSLGDTAGALSGTEGRKAIVFAGAHLPERPGVELYTWIHNAFRPYIRIDLSPDALLGRNGAVRFSIEHAAQKAASSGVTFYVIDGADLGDDVSAEYGGDYLSDGAERSLAYMNTAVAFNNLARITGGVAMLAHNFDAAFNALASDFDSYYALGYQPAEDKVGRRHDIVVKMKNAAYRARARETYQVKNAEDLLNDRIYANIYSDVHGDWEIGVKTGEPRKDGNQFRVPVLIALRPSLALLPKDGKLSGGFTVYIAVGMSDGRRSSITRIPQRVEIAPEGESQLRSRPMTFTMLVAMTPGENFVSVAAVDQVSSSTGFARTTVVLR